MMKVIEPESKAINYTHISTTVTATDLSWKCKICKSSKAGTDSHRKWTVFVTNHVEQSGKETHMGNWLTYINFSI